MTQPLIQPTQIRVGTNAGDIVQLDGSAQLPAVDGSLLLNLPGGVSGLQSIQIFTANGTWTKPAGITLVIVEVVGGGGAGGGMPATVGGEAGAGSGGGSSGLCIAIIDVSAIASETITIGAAGVGAVAANGSGGGTSSFGAHASAVGGNGGGVGFVSTAAGPSVLGGNSGSGIGGDIRIRGMTGSYGIFSTTTNTAYGGRGGQAPLGGQYGESQNLTPPPAGEFGGGGAGVGSNANQPARGGGNGKAGRIIVWEYA